MRVLKFIIANIAPYRIFVLGIFFAMCAIAICDTLKPFLVKQFIDIVSGRKQESLWLIFAFYAIRQLVLLCTWALSDYCIFRYTAKFRLDVIKYFTDRLYDHSYSFFQNQLAGSITSKVGDAFQQLPGIIFTMINPFMSLALTIMISLGLLFSVAPTFAIFMVIWLLLFLAIVAISMKKGVIINKNYSEEKSKIIGFTSDYLSNMMSVKLFANKTHEQNYFLILQKPFLMSAKKLGIYQILFYLLLGILTTIYALCFLASLILGYKEGVVSPGDFVLVIMTNFNIMSTLFELPNSLREFMSNWGAVDQAIAILDEHEIVPADSQSTSTLQVSRGQIIFDKVKFHYKGTDPLFEDLNIEIRAGQKVGLVGYSGGGKTSFANLILRLYDVTEGRIFIDGQNINEVTQDSLRSNIAMIPQDPSLFHRSIMDNIRYGRIDASDAEVIEASRRAHAHEFIMTLPSGYESLVGERGVKLSGGQRQRIAIARAILKNAPILILDEATSALDSVTENLIQESLLELMNSSSNSECSPLEDSPLEASPLEARHIKAGQITGARTTIVIAHRLSTLLHMDRILVFNKGKIIEDGTHHELVKSGGHYRELWDAQVGGFLGDEKAVARK